MTGHAERFSAALAAMPLVAILRGIRPEEAVAVATAIVDAGIGILEVPLNSPNPLDSVRRMLGAVGERAMVGVGTVYRPEEVDASADAGAMLIVSPNADPAVIGRAKRHGLVSLPGVFTPTEAMTALGAGADGLKIFPAELMPPAGVKALRAVLPPGTRVLMVGGIGPDSMAAYRAAGADGFGIGSALYAPGRSAAEVGEKARAFVAAAFSSSPLPWGEGAPEGGG